MIQSFETFITGGEKLMKWHIGLIVLMSGVFLSLLGAEITPGFYRDDVPRFGGFELIITNDNNYSNPFDYQEIELTATFTSPDNRELTAYGFYDGDGKGGQEGNVWRLRFMPDKVGDWSYSYSWIGSSSKKPNGDDGSFRCEESEFGGPLRIDEPKGMFVENARGEPFHMRPYDLHTLGTYGTLDEAIGWGAYLNWSTNTYTNWVDIVLDTHMGVKKFNSAMINSASATWDGHERTWWLNNDRSLNEFDLEVYRQYDATLNLMRTWEIYSFPFAHFGAEKRGSQATRAFARYTAARHWAYYIFFGWSPSWESSAWDNYGHVMEEVADVIPYDDILLASQTAQPAYGETIINMYMQQVSIRKEDNDYTDLRRQQNRRENWPGFLVGSEDSWAGDDTRKRRTFWADMMAGIIPVHTEFYKSGWGGHTVTPQVVKMFDWFYEKVRYRHDDWNVRNALVGSDEGVLCSGIPNLQYIVYSIRSGSVTIDLGEGDYHISWLNPVSGEEYNDVGTVEGPGTKTLDAPFDGEFVLLLNQKVSTKASRSSHSLNVARRRPRMTILSGASQKIAPVLLSRGRRFDIRGRMMQKSRKSHAVPQ